MTTPLLTTKTHIPPSASLRNVVPRLRLIERLQAGMQSGHALTLVATPAGFGKTTLVSAWVRESAPLTRVGWVSLDEDDNDPARFWSYVVTALQDGDEGFGKSVLAALRSPQPVPLKDILTDLLNQIADSSQPLLLVLDDFHVISNLEIHETLAFLLDHQPQQLHLILCSRADPPLAIGRLRAQGQLTELRADELRFSEAEATAFLNDVMGLDLRPEDIKLLESRTEGWIVGLQLAAIALRSLEEKQSPPSMQGHADAHAFISAFTGSHRYVLEYLTEEVFFRQRESVQRFLLLTSILERFCGPLCDAVLDSHAPASGSQSLLDELYRTNLFLVALDDEQKWSRYHHLFADLLGNLLRREHPSDHIQELHHRASVWYAENGFPDDAVKHALQAQDFERAASLIEGAARGSMLDGRLTTLLRWVDALPEASRCARPRLRFYQAWALHLGGKSETAEQILHDARRDMQVLPPSPDNLALRGELAALLTSIATLREEPSIIIQEAQEALAYPPETDRVSRARVNLALGTAYAYTDETKKATRTFNLARDLALEAGNPFLAAAAIELLAGMQIYHLGCLREGARTLQQVLDMGTTEDGTRLPFTATAHVLLAEVFLEWNDLDAAADYLNRGKKLLQQGGIGYSLTHTYCVQSRLRQALGDSNAAVDALRKAVQASETYPMLHFIIHQASCQVRLALWQGDIEAASRWARGDPQTIGRTLPENLAPYLREVLQISQARLYLAQGKTAKVLEMFHLLYAPARAAGRNARIIEISLLKALALQAQGDTIAARQALEQPLSLAQREGYVRLFLEEGEPMAALLQQAAATDIEPDYANDLLAAFDQPVADKQQLLQTPDVSSARPPAPLVEPLTRRELEVLRLVVRGLSNQEIAETLFITVGTVKTHVHHIYGKLEVRDRPQAIARARNLNLDG